MNVRFALAGIAFLLLAACASTPRQPLAPAPPVKVVITAEPSVQKLVDVARINSEMALALRRLAPSASPMTVTVHFVGTSMSVGGGFGPGAGADVHGNPEEVTYSYAVASISLTPWLDGYRPVISTVTVPAGMPAANSQVVLYGKYTITDATGRTLEEKPLLIAPGRYQRELAVDLALRVAAVAHGS